MRTGRPTKYSKRIIEKANEYLKTYKEKGDVIPTVAALSIELKINRETLYAWASKHSDFSNIMTELKNVQERELINGSVNGSMNSTIAKLILHKHDYSERQQIDHTTKGESIQGVTREVVK